MSDPASTPVGFSPRVCLVGFLGRGLGFGGLSSLAFFALIQMEDGQPNLKLGVLAVASLALGLVLARYDFIWRRERHERVVGDKRLKELEEQLQHARKLELLGSFAGGLAHDINNCLSVVIAEAEMSSDLDAREQILLAASRAADLTKQILGFGRRDGLNTRPVFLEPLLKSSIRSLERILPKSIELRLRLDGLRDAVVVLDPAQVSMLVLNLGANARDAMPNGGVITLTGESVEDRVLFKVEDTGEGIDPDVLPRICEPFFTTKPIGRGTGLGLSNVKSIVKKAGGRLRVESTLGLGTSFMIELPRSPASAAKTTQVPSFGAGRGESILVVEDDLHLRASLVARLSAMGYRVKEARSGWEAIDLMARGLELELLLTDTLMPIVDGAALLEWTRLHRPSVGRLLISGSPPKAELVVQIESGDLLHLSKPLPQDELQRAVSRALSARVPLRETG